MLTELKLWLYSSQLRTVCEHIASARQCKLLREARWRLSLATVMFDFFIVRLLGKSLALYIPVSENGPLMNWEANSSLLSDCERPEPPENGKPHNE